MVVLLGTNDYRAMPRLPSSCSSSLNDLWTHLRDPGCFGIVDETVIRYPPEELNKFGVRVPGSDWSLLFLRWMPLVIRHYRSGQLIRYLERIFPDSPRAINVRGLIAIGRSTLTCFASIELPPMPSQDKLYY